MTSNSFKPAMAKELKQLERTNKKLQKHTEQYQHYYQEMLMGEQRDQIEEAVHQIMTVEEE